MKKSKLSLFLIPMLLVACNKPASDSATGSTESVNRPNVSENTLKGLIVNAPGREDEVYESVSGDATAPSHPIIKGQLFKGWYTERTGGEKWDFASGKETPSVLYAQWEDFSNKNDTEYLDAFLSLLKDLSGTVNHTVGDSSFSIQYATAAQVFTGSNGFVSDRYENSFVQTKNYSPYYAENDYQVKPEDKGKTAEQVNTENYFSLVEDSYTDGAVYTITQYNKGFQQYDASQKDGYEKTANVTEEKASSYLDISFASYFLGYPSQLLASMKAGHEFYRAETDSEDQEKEGDFYYFNQVDPTTIDPWDKKGTNFEIGYAISTQKDEYLWTDYYRASAGIAFKDGKIAHCTVEKVNAALLNNEAQMLATRNSFYDFYQGDYASRAYNGTKLDYHNFEQYED